MEQAKQREPNQKAQRIPFTNITNGDQPAPTAVKNNGGVIRVTGSETKSEQFAVFCDPGPSAPSNPRGQHETEHRRQEATLNNTGLNDPRHNDLPTQEPAQPAAGSSEGGTAGATDIDTDDPKDQSAEFGEKSSVLEIDWTESVYNDPRLMGDWAQPEDSRSELKDDWAEPGDSRSELEDDWTEPGDSRSELEDDWTEPGDSRSELEDDWTEPGDSRSELEDDWAEPGDSTSELEDDWAEPGDSTSELEDDWAEPGDSRSELEDDWAEPGDDVKGIGDEGSELEDSMEGVEDDAGDGVDDDGESPEDYKVGGENNWAEHGDDVEGTGDKRSEFGDSMQDVEEDPRDRVEDNRKNPGDGMAGGGDNWADHGDAIARLLGIKIQSADHEARADEAKWAESGDDIAWAEEFWADSEDDVVGGEGKTGDDTAGVQDNWAGLGDLIAKKAGEWGGTEPEEADPEDDTAVFVEGKDGYDKGNADDEAAQKRGALQPGQVSASVPRPIVRHGADPHTCPAYERYIYRHMQDREFMGRPRKGFMDHQQDITPWMRGILLDWMLAVMEESKDYGHETLFTAVGLVDRYLNLMPVPRKELQTVGAAAMLLAEKFHEYHSHWGSEMADLTDNSCTKEELHVLQVFMLYVLDFDVSFPTMAWFAQHLLAVTSASFDAKLRKKIKNLTLYLCYLVLVVVDKFLDYPPSMLAAAALCLARHTLRFATVWNSLCVSKSLYELEELEHCVRQLLALQQDLHGKKSAWVFKFAMNKYGRVSEIEPLDNVDDLFSDLHKPPC